jgi:hypothetical protein
MTAEVTLRRLDKLYRLLDLKLKQMVAKAKGGFSRLSRYT